MGQLPRSIPSAALQELREAMAAAGITLGSLAEGKRVTYTAEHRSATWEITFMGRYYGWAVRGPGMEHGVGAATEDVPEVMNRPAGPQLPDGPLEWAVRGEDSRVWPCADQVAAEETTAEAPHMVALHRVPGGDWQEWRPALVNVPTAGAPRTYAGVPVPDLVRESWDDAPGRWWRLGVRSSMAR
ncbi:hypothetical protein ACKI16_23790 [Streptomyces scabiei]|uniref:hypothetical protein n=1 Tax=Streptomyces scabiei TaxID=1930 RepID=UPI0038F768D1